MTSASRGALRAYRMQIPESLPPFCEVMETTESPRRIPLPRRGARKDRAQARQDADSGRLSPFKLTEDESP